MNKDIKEVQGATKYTEHYYVQHAEVIKKVDKKLAEKLLAISEAAKETSEYIKTRVD